MTIFKEITNLLGVLFTQYVSTIVPPSSLGVAKLSKTNLNSFNRITKLIYIFEGIYLLSVWLLCMLSLIGNIIVLNLHNKDVRIENDMPIWVKYYLL